MTNREITIAELPETTFADEESFIPIDNGDITYKIKVSDYNAGANATARAYAEAAGTHASAAAESAISAAEASDLCMSRVEMTESNVRTASDKANEAQTYANTAYEYAAAASTSASNATSQAQQVSDYAREAGEKSEDAEAYAVGQRKGVDVTSEDETFENNAKYYKEQASAEVARISGLTANVASDALKAEGYAVGTQNGSPIISEYLQHNAKYYAENAASSAQEAQFSKDTAILFASRVEDTVVKVPYIGSNNHWYVYNFDQEKYIDTNVNATGSAVSEAQIYAAVERYFNEHGTPAPTKTLSSISASKTKTTYNVGETLNTNDITVTANYSDSTTANVTSSATINTSNVDTSTAGNYNIQISYTEGNVIKTTTVAITVTVVSIIDVGIGDNYTYHSIKSAESAVQDGGTIRIHEGTYDEYGIGTSNKAITYEGVDKDTCIVQNGLSDKMYSVFDLCGGNKTVKNLTIHQTHSDPQNPETSTVAYKAYSVHCDMPSCAGHTYKVENCILKNRYFACCGIGLWQDAEVIVKDCDIDLYDTNRDITGTGAYYCHCNTDASNVTGQKISVINNTIHADQSLAIRVDTAKTAGSEMICEFIDNTCSSDLYGTGNDCVNFVVNDYTTLTETSTGNNVPILNASVSPEYVAPEGLKDTGSWFVVYDKTKDKYYAGNYTGKITRGYKTSSSQQLSFTVTASNSGRINGWTSTDGETWTQVTTNQPTYSATTVATNVNTDTAGKYAFGSGQYNDDIVLIDAWSDSEFSWEY